MQLLGGELKQLGLISLSARRGGRSHWLPLQGKSKEITAKRETQGSKAFTSPYAWKLLQVETGNFTALQLFPTRPTPFFCSVPDLQ